MKFARFIASSESKVRTGIVEKSKIKEITGSIFDHWEYTGEQFSHDVKLLSPLIPNNIMGVGMNYVDTLKNVPNPSPNIRVFFYKPISSVIGTDEDVILPDTVEEVLVEAELAIVIGKTASKIKKEDVDEVIFGATINNDVTATQFFDEKGPDGFHWTIGKSFDTFTPLGPVIETNIDIDTITVEMYVNGEQKQSGTTDLMIVPIREMISEMSHVMTLQPGDVILTGTPKGACKAKSGDLIECGIQEIGMLRNRIVKK